MSVKFLCLALLFALVAPMVTALTCTYCDPNRGINITLKCRPDQICCNNNLRNGNCTDAGQTCPPAIQCSQVTCGSTCAGAQVYCPVGQVCCNGCPGRNLCVLPGTTCDLSCPGC